MTRFETLAADWLSHHAAVQRILAAARPLPPETRPLDEALGLALAEDVTASLTLPPWDNSAMDGYAVAGSSIRGATPEEPIALEVVGRAPAGSAGTVQVGPGKAVRIMTGAPVPPGADTVVRVEHTDAEKEEAGLVRVRSDRDLGRNVRPRGQDVRVGELALAAGTSVGPGQVGLLAALGMEEVRVHRPPTVAILASGDELAGPGEFQRVVDGQAIPDSNGPTLAAAVRAVGAVPMRLGIARDTRESVREMTGRARGADLLLTIGGASMGEGDLFKRVLDEMGFELDFWRVRIRPGSPFGFGRLPSPDGSPPLPVFGLPGNPASAFVTFHVFVRPFLAALGGHSRVFGPRVRARASEAVRTTPDLAHFVRVILEWTPGGWTARPTGHQSSALVSSLGRADGLAVVPEGVGTVAVGEEVEVILVDRGPGTIDARSGGLA